MSISVDQDGSIWATAAGTTGSDGTATFVASNFPSGCYTTTITGVTADGLTWDGMTPPNEKCK